MRKTNNRKNHRTQKPALSDMDLKQLIRMFEKIGKIENCDTELEKDQMEILDLKNRINEIMKQTDLIAY
jgi:hypothetical protein